ncbi:hypothetical protein PORY_001529 [Pneumocystis oryctolagi]|uniref:Uncharacterized protein n=1 Tax=Pneumocystis oryctolagi TaxID=42067 RepID=A0ACB7CIB4_9ASCO|nr:hypothetical protein PORY_001529 [Pneumocystis oryctolagi]
MRFSLGLSENILQKTPFLSESSEIQQNTSNNFLQTEDFKEKPVTSLNQGKTIQNDIDCIFYNLKKKVLCTDILRNSACLKDNSTKEGPNSHNTETVSVKIRKYLGDDYPFLSKTSQSFDTKDSLRRSKSSSPRKPLKLKENINEHNLFNISEGFKNMQIIDSLENLDTKVSSIKKTCIEREKSPKRPWTPQRIILQQENETLKERINELKERLEENEKDSGENDTYCDTNNIIIEKLKGLVDFLQMELTIYLEAKDCEFNKLKDEFESIKMENKELKEQNSDLLRMWELEKERVKRREKQLGMEQMKNKQISAQMGMLEEAMITRQTLHILE